MCVCVCVCGRSSVVVRSSPKQLCGVYGGQFDLSSLPSNTWQIACVLYGGGCVLLGFSSLAAVFCLLLPSHWAKRLASYTGYIQTMAGNIILCIILHIYYKNVFTFLLSSFLRFLAVLLFFSTIFIIKKH